MTEDEVMLHPVVIPAFDEEPYLGPTLDGINAALRNCLKAAAGEGNIQPFARARPLSRGEARMSWIQRFFTAVFPASWARSMEEDSRRWMMRCRCGFEQSIWEMGGIRWKAHGTSRNYMRCVQCGERSWHTLYRKTQDS